MGDREVLESEIWKLQDKMEILESRLISAGQQLQVCSLSCLELEKVNDGLVETVVDLRSALEGLKGRDCFCQSGDNPILAGICLPACKKAMATLKG